MGINEIIEISKPRIVVLLVITAVTSMFAASKLVSGAPSLDYFDY
ncbi:MAG: protoheme IX farnesyltransferase, partial [Nitrosopumilus sp.]|nr:protoheme IX farnesyltransferase [Nitrosopumilus sp.]MBT4550158.1 protoheme IX farnesyltransferase [Nitrosopumilus sp.]